MPSNNTIRFSQSCPTCGRRIQVRASLLGSTVACLHCNAEFTATGREDDDASHTDSNLQLMARVEKALQTNDTATTTPIA